MRTSYRPGVGPRKNYSGGEFGRTKEPRVGVIAALDVTTQKVKWRHEWPDVCTSGSVNTAGGLLLMGRLDGRVMALDKRDGNTLWEWQLDAPITAPITTFEHHGEQMLAVYAAGNYYSGSRARRWRVAAVAARRRCNPGKPFIDAAAIEPVLSGAAWSPAGGNAEAGRTVFQRTCEPCHGETGKGGHAEGATCRTTSPQPPCSTPPSPAKKDMPSFAQHAQPAGTAGRGGLRGAVAEEVIQAQRRDLNPAGSSRVGRLRQ